MAEGKLDCMPRTARIAPGGRAYHAMNRGCGRCTLFETAKDYMAFERVIDYALERHPTRILGYCLMPNHFHFVLWPERDGELTGFMRSLTHPHSAMARISPHGRYGPPLPRPVQELSDSGRYASA